MRNRKKMKMAVYVSTAMWTVLACTFLLMKPAVENTSSFRSAMVISLGLTFWSALLLAVIFQIKTSLHYRKICRKENIHPKGLPGIFRFFSNPIAAAADICLIVSLLGGWGLLRYPIEELYIYSLELFLLTLSISLHCIWNGKAVRMLYNGKSKEAR